ncbi:hypothetical protein LCGC14_0981190 [marine sediment metagenome]|uniref:Uncharacterized protein n=1 Tax=marine sediment metagenome TaxID=412755 RepID=A0A0F9NV25_9ZZZZ
MPNFVCQHCGMITDSPEIVPHPGKDTEYRELFKEYEAYWQDHRNLGHFFMLRLAQFEGLLKGKYNHSITCLVCLNETRFWRDEPFPVGILI